MAYRVRTIGRRRPRLSSAERQRRRKRARGALLPRAVEATGRKGFYETQAALERHRDKVAHPTRLAGYLKGEAKRAGVLSPRHPYVGRRRRRRISR